MKKNYPGIYYMIKITCLAVISAIILIVVSIPIGNYQAYNYAGNKKKKKEIINFVHENKALIEESIQNNKFGELRKKGVDDVFKSDEDEYVRFKCDGEGFVFEGVDYGFIYSKNHDIDRFYYGSDDFKKEKTRYGYYFEDLYGDNDCYIEEIEDDYYYYQQFW